MPSHWSYGERIVTECNFVLNAGAGLDFTCLSNQPLLNPTTDGENTIGGYKSGDDTDVAVAFSRAVDTRNGNGLTLPTGYTEEDHANRPGEAYLLKMPQSSGKERIGAFYCEGSKGGTIYKVLTIILHANGIYLYHVLFTVNFFQLCL